MSDYDALVVGGGIGGMESALKLGAMGYRVLVVEKEPSIGGKMVLLSKVFPTLDCASCISTPKMGETAHHPNLTVLTDAEVEGIARDGDGGFSVRVRQRPRFVDADACTGCRLCELACTVSVPDQFNGELVARRAAYIPFPQAVPQKALLERAGTSPCTFSCPAGIKAHGYVSLVRSGEYERAFRLVLETTPLVGSLGRACYAPCEERCTRAELEGPLPIRALKRFVADRHHGEPGVEPAESTGRRVAIVGSGPAGLTAAWQLRLRGHSVKVFESAPVPGGALRLSIPGYRLPAEVVERDVANVTAIGVEIETDAHVDDPEALHASGFDAVLLATGTPVCARLAVAGEERESVWGALEFLRAIKLDDAPELRGRRVVVVGGGNVAIDAARSALRLGAAEVHEVCLEARAQMPAYPFEVEEALAEGVILHDSWGIRGFGPDTVELKRCVSVLDEAGRFSPRYDEAELDEMPFEVAIVAVGLRRERDLDVDPLTLRSAQPWLFAAGDLVSGPAKIVDAVASGGRAAAAIDRFLAGESPAATADPLPVVAHADVLARQRSHSRREALPAFALARAPSDFAELEPPLTEEQARAAAARCLDCGVCSECHECIAACPADAIDLDQREQELELSVGSVIVATGYALFPADAKPQYGHGRFQNVITGVQMERLLAPTRPYNTVLRPSDGRVPERIAYVMCTGSRDETVGSPLCSRFCCMYSIKQNQLIMGALPLADVTVHYIDIRTPGKGYDEFFEQARAMGAQFVKGRVASIAQADGDNLILRYEDVDGGGIVEAEYDLVVLAVGVRPNLDTRHLFSDGSLEFDEFDYVEEPDEDLNPAATSIPGVFVAGAASGARDIPESILHAGAAVAQAAAYLEREGAAA